MSGLDPKGSTRSYTASSCHEVGYRWNIEAPTDLDEEELQRLQDALVYWSDEPEQRHLAELLADPHTLEEFNLTSLCKLRRVRFELSSVHRDFWTQGWETQVDGGVS